MKPCHIISTFVGVVILWLGIGLGPFLFYSDSSERAAFGDMFGAVNALFAGLAFLGVVYAILLQKEELSLQRAELKMTRDELRRTATAQEESTAALTNQFKVASLTARISGYAALLQSCNDQISSIQISKSQTPQHLLAMLPHDKRLESLQHRRQIYTEALDQLMKEISDTPKQANPQHGGRDG